MPKDGFDPKVEALMAAVTRGAGVLPEKTRMALLKSGDSGLARVLRRDLSEDSIFEATVAAALGEGLKRLAKGRALLKGRS